MSFLGSIIAIGAALVFLVLAGVIAWGGWVTLRSETRRASADAPLVRAGLLCVILGVALLLGGVALFSLPAAGRLLLVALRLG
jgi:hypothetical protein